MLSASTRAKCVGGAKERVLNIGFDPAAFRMYRRKRHSKSARIGSNVVGFYTRNGKVRPITRGRRAALQRPVISKNANARIQEGKPILMVAIDYVLRQAPIAHEIYAAFTLADAIYGNWSTVARLWNAYNEDGVQGMANTIATDEIHDGISNLQTDAVWVAISQFIPQKYHPMGKQLLSSLIGSVTIAEIELAKQFLPPSRNTRSRGCGIGSAQTTALGAHPYDRNASKLPKEIKYV